MSCGSEKPGPADSERIEMPDDENPAELVNEWQPCRRSPDRIGVSLSGGGHRAALFAAGALAAVVDARLADRVSWVAAASGGSLAAGLVEVHGGLGSFASGRELATAALAAVRVGSGFGRKTRRLVSLATARRMERFISATWLRGRNIDLDQLSSTGPLMVVIAVDLLSLQPVYLSRLGVLLASRDVVEVRAGVHLLGGPSRDSR